MPRSAALQWIRVNECRRDKSTSGLSHRVRSPSVERPGRVPMSLARCVLSRLPRALERRGRTPRNREGPSRDRIAILRVGWLSNNGMAVAEEICSRPGVVKQLLRTISSVIFQESRSGVARRATGLEVPDHARYRTVLGQLHDRRQRHALAARLGHEPRSQAVATEIPLESG